METYLNLTLTLINNHGLSILAICISMATLFLLRKQHLTQIRQAETIALLQRDLRALANAAVGVGERVLNVERQSRDVNQHPTDKVHSYDFVSQPYEQAITMAQHGASVSDLVKVCGLSPSEAELVCMMHRLDKAS